MSMGGLVLSFITALVLSVVLMPICSGVGCRFGILDHPSARRAHAYPIPRIGGVGVFLAIAASTLVFMRGAAPFDVMLLLAGAGAFGVIGLIDDIVAAGAWKFMFEALVVIAIVWIGGFRVNLPWPYAGQVLAVLWIVGVANALNCLDCMDGVAAGAAGIAALAFIPLALFAHRWGVATEAAAVAGASIGFLRFNYPPARLFLGDSGSLMLGFLLAGLGAAMIAPQTSPVAWTAPVTVLGIPTIDFLLVHWRRYRGGVRNPLKLMTSSGMDHFPHRLSAMGLSPQWVAARVYVASALCGWCALVFVMFSPRNGLMFSIPVVAIAVLLWSNPAILPGLRRVPSPTRIAQEDQALVPPEFGD
jgi:UDP-GlcNAc:undecaprenyl-phosphate/decaprenyl-phosphate GlcNAc-1-phosphate transferase